MIDIFLVHDDVDRSAAIRQSIGTNSELALVSETQTGREGMFALSTILTGHPRVLVVRLNLGDMNGFDFIAQVKQKHPDVYIVPCLEGNEGGPVWQSLLQLELRDVLNGPIPVPEIGKVLASAAVRAQEFYDLHKERTGSGASGEAYVISVMSARSGLGKTVLATNLAAALARQNDSVILVDFSLNPGDFAVMLDNVPRNTIMDAVAAGGNMDSELLQNLLAQHPLGFRYLACPNQDFDFKSFDYNLGVAMVHALRSLAQYVVIDTGIAMSEPTIAAADNSDIIFLLTSRDVTRLLSAQRFLKYLKEREIQAQKLKVFVNQAEIGVEISENEIETLLEHPVSAYLPCNAGPVAYSINSGVPIVVSEPQHPISVVLNKIAELTFNHWQEKAPEEGEQKSSGKLPSKKGSKISQKLSFR